MPLTTINAAKDLVAAYKPLLLVDITLTDGTALHYSTHPLNATEGGYAVGGVSYIGRVVDHSLAAVQQLGEAGIDVPLSFTVSLADPERVLWMAYEGGQGFRGATLVARLVLADFGSTPWTYSSDSIERFRGKIRRVSLTGTAVDLEASALVDIANRQLPTVPLQQRCPWRFPRTAEERAAGAAAASPFYPCGYDPANGRGTYQSGSTPYSDCGYTASDCKARGLYKLDASGHQTGGFGGISYALPAGSKYREYTSGKWIDTKTQEAKLGDPAPEVFGTAWVEPKLLGAWPEGNSTRGEAVISAGPISSILQVVCNDTILPAATSLTGAPYNIPKGGELMRYNVVNAGSRVGKPGTDVPWSGNGDPYGSLSVIEWCAPRALVDGSGLPSIRCLIQGTPLPQPNTADPGDAGSWPVSYTDNPAWVALALLIRSGFTYADLDLQSFIDAAAICAQSVTYTDINGASSTRPRYTASLVLSQRQAVSDVLRSFLPSFNAVVRPNGTSGKYSLVILGTLAAQQPSPISGSNYDTPIRSKSATGADANGYVAYRFTKSTILRDRDGALATCPDGDGGRPNKVTINFPDCELEYATTSVVLADPDAINRHGEEASTLSLDGLNSFSQASRIGRLAIVSKLYGNPEGLPGGTMEFTWETSMRGLHLQAGQIVLLDDPDLGIAPAVGLKTGAGENLDGFLVRLTRIQLSQDGETIQIWGTWHECWWWTDTAWTEGRGTLTRSHRDRLARPALPWSPDLVSVTGGEFAGSTTMDLTTDVLGLADGSESLSVSVRGRIPVNEFSSEASPLLHPQGTTSPSGGSIPGGGAVYYLALVGLDAAGKRTYPSNTAAVPVTAGGDTNTIAAQVSSWPTGLVSWELYAGRDPNRMTRQSTGVGTPAASISITSLASGGRGLPDVEADSLVVRAKIVDYPGVFQGTVTGVATNTLTIGGASWAANAWANREVTLLATANGSALKAATFTVTASGTNTLTVTPDPVGIVLAGDLVAMRVKPTASGSTLTDSAWANPLLNDGAGLPDVTGLLLRVIAGAGSGHVYRIAANTAASVTIQGTPVAPFDTSTRFILERPEWAAEASVGSLSNSDPDATVSLDLSIPNYTQAAILVQGWLVDGGGQASLDYLSPWREAGVRGAAGAGGGDVPLGDVTGLAVNSTAISADGSTVTMDISATCPADAGFSGCEMFLEIPQEADADPEHPTMPGQIYHQGWWYAEPSGSLSDKMVVPTPPLAYLQGLATPVVTWVVYALSRSWGYCNELVRLDTVTPLAPANRTPVATVTIDFTAYISAAQADNGLASINLSGSPVVTAGADEVVISQDYAPPYFGIPGAFTIGAFEGVMAVVEYPDGKVVDCGSHPYTKDPLATPPANVETLTVRAPMPASLPATLYLHMMSYSNNDRQKFKQVLHGGVPTVHSQYAIATVVVTAAGVVISAPAIDSVVVETRNLPGEGWSYRLGIALSGTCLTHPNYEGTDVYWKASDQAVPGTDAGWLALRMVAHHAKGGATTVYSDWFPVAAGTVEVGYLKAVATEAGGQNPEWSSTYGPATINIPKDDTRPDRGHSYGFGVVLKGYKADGNNVLMAQLDVSFTPLSGSGYNYSIWEHAGTDAPADPALWTPTGVGFISGTGTMWATVPDGTAVTMWYCLVANNPALGQWYTPADYISDAVPKASVVLPPRGLADHVTGFSVTVNRAETSDIPRGYFSFAFTPPADPDFAWVRFFRCPADSNFTPTADYMEDPVCGLTVAGRQDGDWPIPSTPEYWIFKAVSYNALGEPNLVGAPTYNVTVAASTSGVRASALKATAVAAGSPVTVDGSGKITVASGAILSDHIAALDVGKLNGQVVASQIASVNASTISGSITAGQIGSITAGQITGQIASGQIASIDASKISGSVQANQIAAVNASAISGSIASGQIASLTAGQITGVIVTSQLADGILNTARVLGSNIQAPVAVASLPTLPNADYPVGTLAVRTTDNTIWENVAGAWAASSNSAVAGKTVAADINSVNSSALVGLVTAGQIASITAGQITGTITSDKIAYLTADKITGSITSSQIASIDATKITGSIASSQITSIDATKITGSIASSQIQSIDSSKITGSISATQIGSITADKITGSIVAAQIGSVNATTVVLNSSNKFGSVWTGGSITAAGSIYSDTGDIVATTGTLRGAGLYLTGSSYTISDPASFRSAIGAAASSAAVTWSDIQGKPTLFPPEAHTHDYAPSVHTHPYSALGHTHSVQVQLGTSAEAVEGLDGVWHTCLTDVWVVGASTV